LRALQTELSALETELADPSNPLLQTGKEDDPIDPGELIRGLVDVRGRLDKIRKDKQGRGKLVGVVLGERTQAVDESQPKRDANPTLAKLDDNLAKSDARSVVEMDRRVGELEKLLGSSSLTLDEVSPLSLFTFTTTHST
jgi:nuclear migration protein JNM1